MKHEKNKGVIERNEIKKKIQPWQQQDSINWLCSVTYLVKLNELVGKKCLVGLFNTIYHYYLKMLTCDGWKSFGDFVTILYLSS